MPRRKQRNTRKRSSTVRSTASSVVVRDVSQLFTAASVINFYIGADVETPSRPTSARLSFSSAEPVWWQVKAYYRTSGAENMAYESVKFTTCGNSITRSFRCSRNTPFGPTELALTGPCWAVSVSGPGMVVGTVTFSTRGPSFPDQNTPDIIQIQDFGSNNIIVSGPSDSTVA